jgi:hypothetical protein
MATWERVCEILGKLPGATQDPADRMRAFRVAGKLVAYMPGNTRSQPAHFGEDEVLVIRTDFHERAALIQEDSETFAVMPHYETYRGVLVRLATVPDDLLRELLIEAWRLVAPKRLVRQLDEA